MLWKKQIITYHIKKTKYIFRTWRPLPNLKVCCKSRSIFVRKSVIEKPKYEMCVKKTLFTDRAFPIKTLTNRWSRRNQINSKNFSIINFRLKYSCFRYLTTSTEDTLQWTRKKHLTAEIPLRIIHNRISHFVFGFILWGWWWR